MNYKESELTEWFSGDQLPVRPGVYQRQYDDGCWYYCYFDGNVFFNPETIAIVAHNYYLRKEAVRSLVQNIPWRGLKRTHEQKPSTQASRIIQSLRHGWKTYNDLQAERLSACPWKRIAETGSEYLKEGEKLMREKRDGIVYMRVAKE